MFLRGGVTMERLAHAIQVDAHAFRPARGVFEVEVRSGGAGYLQVEERAHLRVQPLVGEQIRRELVAQEVADNAL